MMKEHWADDQIIGVNSLVRSDDSVVLLNCYSVIAENGKLHFCFPLCDTTTKSLFKYEEDIWTSFQIFCKIETENNIYVGGQGAMGNEGFIACLDSERSPIWTLFFENSNPFYEISIEEGILEAVTSLDLKYHIDLEFPERLTITNFVWED